MRTLADLLDSVQIVSVRSRVNTTSIQDPNRPIVQFLNVAVTLQIDSIRMDLFCYLPTKTLKKQILKKISKTFKMKVNLWSLKTPPCGLLMDGIIERVRSAEKEEKQRKAQEVDPAAIRASVYEKKRKAEENRERNCKNADIREIIDILSKSATRILREDWEEIWKEIEVKRVLNA